MGKTTNLQYIYKKTNPESKGKLISLATETERTLFFDFLPLNLGDIRGFKTRFHLYTVPGQVFYDASRKLILKGVDGVVFVADSQVERMEANIESVENLRINLNEQGYNLDKIPYTIQYNKRDLPNIVPVDELNRALNQRGSPGTRASPSRGSACSTRSRTSPSRSCSNSRRVLTGGAPRYAPAPVPWDVLNRNPGPPAWGGLVWTLLLLSSTPAHSLSPDEGNTIRVFDDAHAGVVNITNYAVAYDYFLTPIPTEASGTGSIIDRNGHILTNNHVVANAKRLQVTLADGTHWPAKLVGRDPQTDLAVIRINAPGPPEAAPVGRLAETARRTKGPRDRESVRARADPHDWNRQRGPKATQDRRRRGGGRDPDGRRHQSRQLGGPLLDSEGRMVGINTAIFPLPAHRPGSGSPFPSRRPGRSSPS